MGAKLGLNAKAYRLTSGTRATWTASATLGIYVAAAPASLDEITAVNDVTLGISKGRADVSTRGNNGWRANLGTLKDASVELTAIWDPADADLQALLQAFLLNTDIALALLDGDKATVGTQGLWADFQVMDFNKNEPLEEGQTVTITVMPSLTSVPPQWVQVSV